MLYHTILTKPSTLPFVVILFYLQRLKCCAPNLVVAYFITVFNRTNMLHRKNFHFLNVPANTSTSHFPWHANIFHQQVIMR